MDKKYQRAKNRFLLGGNIMPDSYVFVTLTTPEEAFDIDMHRAWRMLRMRMTRRNCSPAYYAVTEWNKRLTCRHLHVCFRMSYVSVQLLREQWTKVINKLAGTMYRNLWVKAVQMYGEVGKRCWYVAKYMAKSIKNSEAFYGLEHRLYWYSADWIYAGWSRISKALWGIGKRFDNETLVALRAGERIEVIVISWIQEIIRRGFYMGEYEQRKLQSIGIDMTW